MPLLGFKKQFKDQVKNCVKTQSVRAKRKRPFKRGDHLYLYYGLRTKHCEWLGVSHCTDVADIVITDGNIQINGRYLSVGEIITFAKDDGFDNGDAYEEFFSFFRENHGFPFEGQVIFWDDPFDYYQCDGCNKVYEKWPGYDQRDAKYLCERCMAKFLKAHGIAGVTSCEESL